MLNVCFPSVRPLTFAFQIECWTLNVCLPSVLPFRIPNSKLPLYNFLWSHFSENALAVGIKEVIETINRMQADGIIDRYAIGGAVGATFYLEPVATLDVDIFIAFSTDLGRKIVSLEPIYDYLKSKGCNAEDQYIVIGGWPVQFLPCQGSLLEEALAKAIERDVESIRTHVFSAEHLAAIALQTGRAKDKARLLQFIEAGVMDKALLREIVTRHELLAQWGRFEEQFLT
jgi:hypothetical protein